ncbi:hypothetical protein NESM_000910400 [Novymonas esmeraldas]|uniref:Uncharacterized protein n=1 Tax=Novymonas esmeraldas TaxID=1808958 RepID=A0AAW0F0W5_9TRYP
MDQGRAIEFGAPLELLDTPNSAFSALVGAFGSAAAEAFRSAVASRDSVSQDSGLQDARRSSCASVA